MAKDKTETKKLSLIEEQPKEIIGKIQNHLKKTSIQDVTNFARASKTIFSKSKRSLDQIKAEKAQELLTHVVKGVEDKVLKMIKAHPELLLIKSKAKDYSGRTIVGTALQAALGAEDVIMCQKILPYFDNINDGKKVALKQFNEQFPDGLDAELKKDMEMVYNFKPFLEAFHNINGRHVYRAIEKFRNIMSANNEIRQGKYFNMHHLIAAYEVYVNHSPYARATLDCHIFELLHGNLVSSNDQFIFNREVI